MAAHMLFGGAFSVVLPENVRDVSLVRQVPDNQEVFVHPQTDQSIVVELMEAVALQEPDDVAIKTYFEDLATANGAGVDYAIIHSEQIAIDHLQMKEANSCWYIMGEQNISKFDEVVKNTVQIHMGILRLIHYSTDILLTLNDPINISVESSSHHAVPTCIDKWNTDHFHQALTSLQLLDPGIFGL